MERTNSQGKTGQSTRIRRGIIVSASGLILNIILGVFKLIAGLASSSASILADAVNNLTDSASGVITVSSFKLSSKKADKEHPFGHGRYEYIAGLAVGIIILLAGFEFFVMGIERIALQVEIEIGVFAVSVLGISVAVKIFMAVFYRITAKKINSDALNATFKDSLFDALTTSVVLASFFLDAVLPFRIDGYCTILVSGVILWGGIKVIRSAVGKLIGNCAPPELIRAVYNEVMSNPLISGAHDLHIHDYGPDKKIGTIHAEFKEDLRISKAHRLIDEIEKEVLKKFDVELVIHVDPIDFSDPAQNEIRIKIDKLLNEYGSGASMHELSIDYDSKIIAFDIKLNETEKNKQDDIRSRLKNVLPIEFGDFSLIINFDIIYD